MLEQAIEKHTLIGVKDFPSLCQCHETYLIDFPRGRMGGRVLGSWSSETMNPFTTLAIVHKTQRGQRSRRHLGFFERFPTCGLFEVGLVTGFAFRDAPRGFAVIGPRGMNEQDFKTTGSMTIEQRSG